MGKKFHSLLLSYPRGDVGQECWVVAAYVINGDMQYFSDLKARIACLRALNSILKGGR
jgi:hypothetical protein